MRKPKTLFHGNTAARVPALHFCIRILAEVEVRLYGESRFMHFWVVLYILILDSELLD